MSCTVQTLLFSSTYSGVNKAITKYGIVWQICDLYSIYEIDMCKRLGYLNTSAKVKKVYGVYGKMYGVYGVYGIWSNGKVVKVLGFQSRDLVFKITGWL